MLKRGLGLLTAVLTVLTLAACGQKQEQPTISTTQEPVVQATQPTTAATEPPQTETTEPTEATQPPPTLEPVTWLTSVQWKTYPEFLSLGEGTILACQNYFEEGRGIVNFLDVFNVYEDQLLAQGGNDSPRQLVQQTFDDGCIVLSDPAENTFYVYDQQLQVLSSFTAPNTEGFFSHDRSSYYYVENRVLYRMDVATGNFGRVRLAEDLRLERLVSIHPQEDWLCAKVYLSPYGEESGFGLLDISTGEVLFLQKDVEHLWLDGDRFYAAKANDQVFGSDIYTGSLEGGQVQYLTAQTLGSDTVSYSVLSDSGYLVLRTVDEENLTTTVYDLEQEAACSMADYGYLTSALSPVYLPQEQLIFALWPDGYYFSPVVLDPKALSFDTAASMEVTQWDSLVDESLLADYGQLPDASSQLQTQRQRADALETKYGIRILLGQQTQLLWDGVAQPEENPERIDAALTQLETVLALYPEGFFPQFCNGIGEGGVYICLTGRIDGELLPLGQTKAVADRYDIAIDITAEGFQRTAHHEIWHAIEMKLSTDSFAHPQWEACNPEGFAYYGHYDKGYGALTQDTYAVAGAGCYFVDAYSKINGTEDRARIMETVMATDATDLLQSLVLREKLKIMSTTIRNHFNTDGWQVAYWEREL